MKLYQEKFEIRFLEETSTFYGHQARKFLETGDVGNYMTQVLQVLKDEECRAFEFLDKYVEKNFIVLIHKGCYVMFQDDNIKTDREIGQIPYP